MPQFCPELSCDLPKKGPQKNATVFFDVTFLLKKKGFDVTSPPKIRSSVLHILISQCHFDGPSAGPPETNGPHDGPP